MRGGILFWRGDSATTPKHSSAQSPSPTTASTDTGESNTKTSSSEEDTTITTTMMMNSNCDSNNGCNNHNDNDNHNDSNNDGPAFSKDDDNASIATGITSVSSVSVSSSFAAPGQTSSSTPATAPSSYSRHKGRKATHAETVKVRLNPIMHRMKKSLDRMQELEERLHVSRESNRKGDDSSEGPSEGASTDANTDVEANDESSDGGGVDGDASCMSSCSVKSKDEDAKEHSTPSNNANNSSSSSGRKKDAAAKQSRAKKASKEDAKDSDPGKIHSRSRTLLTQSVEMLQRKMQRIQAMEEMVEQCEDRRQDLQHLFLQTSLSKPRLDLSAAQSRAKELEQEVDTMRDTNSILRDQCAKLQRQQQRANQEWAQQLEAVETQRDLLTEDLQQRQLKLMQVSEERDEYQMQAQHWQQQAASVSLSVSTASDGHPDLQRKCDQLQQTNAEQARRIAELESLLEQHQQMKYLQPPPPPQSVATSLPARGDVISPSSNAPKSITLKRRGLGDGGVASDAIASKMIVTSSNNNNDVGEGDSNATHQQPPIPHQVSFQGHHDDDSSVCSMFTTQTSASATVQANATANIGLSNNSNNNIHSSGRPSLLSKFFSRTIRPSANGNSQINTAGVDDGSATTWHGSSSQPTKQQQLAQKISLGLQTNNERVIIPNVRSTADRIPRKRPTQSSRRVSMGVVNLQIARQDD